LWDETFNLFLEYDSFAFLILSHHSD